MVAEQHLTWEAGLAASILIAAGLALRRRGRHSRAVVRHRESAEAAASEAAASSRALRPEIEIVHCVKCRWYLRAGWMAQELLASFGDDLASVRLTPGPPGDFQVLAWEAGELTPVMIWDRRRDGGFPEAKELKAALRDAVLPQRALGKCIERAVKK